MSRVGGGIHGLVNLVEISKKICFREITKEYLEDIMRTNFISPFIFTQKMVERMICAEEGSIAFVSHVSALDGECGRTVDASSAAAVIGAARSMAKELGSHQIRVNAVALGAMKGLSAEHITDEMIQKEAGMTDLKRVGEPREAADVLMFLMSDMSSHITGQTIRVDGGVR